MKLVITKKDIVTCCSVIVILSILPLYCSWLATKDYSNTPGYIDLMAIYDKIELGMDITEVKPLIIEHSDFLRIPSMDHLVPVPSKYFSKITVTPDSDEIRLHTPGNFTAKKPTMAILFVEQKVVAVVIRISDSFRDKPRYAPADKIESNTRLPYHLQIPETW